MAIPSIPSSGGQGGNVPPPKTAAPFIPMPTVHIDVRDPKLPVRGWVMDTVTSEHPATGTQVYNFVDPDTGDTVVQIPVVEVLNLVAKAIARIQADVTR
jgi:hypothetical protein